MYTYSHMHTAIDQTTLGTHVSLYVQGMTYLHDSPVGRHGRLKSSNVLVDSNWSCRITDIAMPFFREGEVRIQDEHQIPCFGE